jgi:predicted phosphodiesterase
VSPASDRESTAPKRVAALYDIHANLPALDAVLEDVRKADITDIVVGGDVLPGPMPRETFERLLKVGIPTHFIHGNGDLAVLAQMVGARTGGGSVTYWGTISGKKPDESIVDVFRWTAAQLSADYEAYLAAWPKILELSIEGLGRVLFCHSTPRSETEGFTRLTAESVLLPLFEPLGVDVVVCGHTHMQFDRLVGRTRVVNAGSVGAPFGEPAAYWLLVGPHIQFRRTSYDLYEAAARIRATSYPQSEKFALESVLSPPSEETMLNVFRPYELTP